MVFKYFFPFIVFHLLFLARFYFIFFIVCKRIMMCSGGIMELLKKRVSVNHSVFGSRIVRELWLFVIFIDWVYLFSTFKKGRAKINLS